MLNTGNSHFREKNVFRDVLTFLLLYGVDFLKALRKDKHKRCDDLHQNVWFYHTSGTFENFPKGKEAS